VVLPKNLDLTGTLTDRIRIDEEDKLDDYSRGDEKGVWSSVLR
jgi:hypothetical protein